jgi:hypothetical protein
MVDWILQHGSISAFIGTSLFTVITALISFYVYTKVRLNSLASVVANQIKSSKEEKENEKTEIKRFKEAVDREIKLVKEDLRCVEQEQNMRTEQIRDDIRGIQQNVKELTSAIQRLVGFLEGKEIIGERLINLNQGNN